MEPLQSKDIVQRVMKEKGKLLIFFGRHDGCFQVSGRALKKRVLQALQDREEITFTFDRDLNILSIR